MTRNGETETIIATDDGEDSIIPRQ